MGTPTVLWTMAAVNRSVQICPREVSTAHVDMDSKAQVHSQKHVMVSVRKQGPVVQN